MYIHVHCACITWLAFPLFAWIRLLFKSCVHFQCYMYMYIVSPAGSHTHLYTLTYTYIKQVKADIESLIPDPSYSGLAVIDFEQWRPLFVHNFDSLAIYQKASEELVAKKHPTWNKTQVWREG